MEGSRDHRLLRLGGGPIHSVSEVERPEESMPFTEVVLWMNNIIFGMK